MNGPLSPIECKCEAREFCDESFQSFLSLPGLIMSEETEVSIPDPQVETVPADITPEEPQTTAESPRESFEELQKPILKLHLESVPSENGHDLNNGSQELVIAPEEPEVSFEQSNTANNLSSAWKTGLTPRSLHNEAVPVGMCLFHLLKFDFFRYDVRCSSCVPSTSRFKNLDRFSVPRGSLGTRTCSFP